jgi:hypothetical protein
VPKSGPTPIEFNAKLYYIAGTLAGVLSISSVFLTFESGSPTALIPSVVFAVVSFLAFRAARNAPR